MKRRGFFEVVAGLLAWRRVKPSAPPIGEPFDPPRILEGWTRLKIGETIKVRMPFRFIAREGMSISGTEIAERFATADAAHFAMVEAAKLDVDFITGESLNLLNNNLVIGRGYFSDELRLIPAHQEPSGDIPMAIAGQDDDCDEWDD